MEVICKNEKNYAAVIWIKICPARGYVRSRVMTGSMAKSLMNDLVITNVRSKYCQPCCTELEFMLVN